MAHPVNPSDKTFRMRVKLVSTDGEELPFKGFMLVPEDRLVLLEKVAAAARDLVTSREDALKAPAHAGKVETALKALGDGVNELGKVWDIPQ